MGAHLLQPKTGRRELKIVLRGSEPHAARQRCSMSDESPNIVTRCSCKNTCSISDCVIPVRNNPTTLARESRDGPNFRVASAFLQCVNKKRAKHTHSPHTGTSLCLLSHGRSTKKTQDAAFYRCAKLQVAEQLQERMVFPRITSCPRR